MVTIMKERNEKMLKEQSKENKGKRKWWLIPVGIVMLLILAGISIPKVLFTDYAGLPTTGPYGVKMVSAILVDGNRVETFEEDGSNREVPVYFYYPDITGTQMDAMQENNDGKSPLVIFSHGAFGYYESNTSTYMELASHGYVVISMDHPYHSFFTTDTEGKTITVNPEFMQEAMGINGEEVTEEDVFNVSRKWMNLRVADMNLVLDSVKNSVATGSMTEELWYVADEATGQEVLSVLTMIDTEKIGLMGHSLGGATSVTVGRTREDIDAVIDLDGTMLGEQIDFVDGEYVYYEDAYPIPLLSIDNEAHHQDSYGTDAPYVNKLVVENALDSKYTYFVGSGHMNFTDLPLLSPILASFLGVGEIDAMECVVTMNEIVLEYFDCYLKDDGMAEIKECY